MKRKTSFVWASVAALALVSCGSDDGGEGARPTAGKPAGPSSSGPAPTSTAPTADPGEPPLPGAAGGEEGVRDAVTGWYRAVADGDGATACGLLTGEARREAMADLLAFNQPCPEVFTALTSQFDDEELQRFRSITVSRATVTGDQAVVQDADLKGLAGTEGMTDEDPDPLRLVRRSQGWLISDLG
ncbi:hypothetical protein [Streptomyces sp. Tu 3180]|uniref:hypothetical protein n=1 Tax=Streptomyces sp. Tu 3180 TaxID=2682611 RepID=UPI00135757DD|nr:hypothetical protein [Streptomyces sp. Tu 3180]KAF3469218.1 hypothetical protein GL259_36365 [Streptomyces sp. Tu 3180]